MKAYWTHKDEQNTGHLHGVLAIEAKDAHGGPHIDIHPDGTTSITYYGKPGGRVSVNLSEGELAILKEKLSI